MNSVTPIAAITAPMTAISFGSIDGSRNGSTAATTPMTKVAAAPNANADDFDLSVLYSALIPSAPPRRVYSSSFGSNFSSDGDRLSAVQADSAEL